MTSSETEFELGTDGPSLILVGVDGSRTSLRAAAYAAGLARRQHCRLLVVHVSRLSAVEHRMGTGPDTRDLDQQIAQARRDKESAVSAEDYEAAAARRDAERQLLADKASRQREWASAHLDLPALADKLHRLTDEVGRMRGLLRQVGIEPQGGAA